MSAEKEETMLRPFTDLSRGSTGALLVALLIVLGGLEPALAQDASQESAAQANEEPEAAEGEEAEAAEGAEDTAEDTADEAAAQGTATEVIEVVGYRQA